MKIIKAAEPVEVCNVDESKCKELTMRFDTGAARCSLDRTLLVELDIEVITDTIFTKPAEGSKCESNEIYVRSSNGGSCRQVVDFVLNVDRINMRMEPQATIADRSEMDYKALCGRRVLARHDILVNSDVGPKDGERQIKKEPKN